MRYRISDTKGTAGAVHRLETMRQAMQALEYGLDAYLGDGDENRVRNSLGKTQGDGRQMSHRWIADRIDDAKLTAQAERDLLGAVRAWRRNNFQLGTQTVRDAQGRLRQVLVRCPYDRSVITVVGANLNRHHRAGQPVSSPCRIPAVRHQISTEFVLPVHLLVE